MAKHISLGKDGEIVASEYLKRRGFKIIDRNFREKFGEIDVVGIAKDKTLVFFEVKTMKIGAVNYTGVRPEDQVTANKLQKFKKIAEFYANKHPELVRKNGYRLDLITVLFPDSGDPTIGWYENVA